MSETRTRASLRALAPGSRFAAPLDPAVRGATNDSAACAVRADATADGITAAAAPAKSFSRGGTSLKTAWHLGQLTRVGLCGTLESGKKYLDVQLSHWMIMTDYLPNWTGRKRRPRPKMQGYPVSSQSDPCRHNSFCPSGVMPSNNYAKTCSLPDGHAELVGPHLAEILPAG